MNHTERMEHGLTMRHWRAARETIIKAALIMNPTVRMEHGLTNDNVHIIKILPSGAITSAISYQSWDERGNSAVNIETSFAAGKSVEETTEFRPLRLGVYPKSPGSFV